MQADPGEIVDYWFNKVGPAGWFGGGEALDARIRAKYLLSWRAARGGAFEDWQSDPAGTLGLLILIDQFPRNMFRGSALSFATDARALRVSRRALQRGDDRRVDEDARSFFTLPFAHSERMVDQDRSVTLAKRRSPRTRANNVLHAKAHRAVIERFGRFPYRNDALGRRSTAAEKKWMEEGGYMAEVRRLGG